MSNVLAPRQRNTLETFARSHVLLAFDFDGTLAPIVDHPGEAEVAVETRGLLRRISLAYPTAVISGRRRSDARRLLRGTGIRHIVGNHGADLVPARAEWRRQIVRWRTSLRREAAGLEGAWIEDKGLSLTVHYRNSPQRWAARRRLWEVASRLPGVRLTAAKEAVNVTLAAVPDKGDALQTLQRKLGCEKMIFVGDDQTDEDVFAREWDGALLGVSVGRHKSAAKFQLSAQRHIDRFLNTLIDLRERP